MRGLKQHRFGNFYGGLHDDFAEDKIPDNAFTRSENWVLRKLGPEKAKGWEKFTDQLLTDGAASPTDLEIRKLDEYAKRDGTNYFICLANTRPYFFRESTDLWIPFFSPS